MGEAKQREKHASDQRILPATERERASLGAWLNTFSPDNRHDRRLCEALHKDLKLDDARDALFAALKEKGDAPISDVCSDESVSYATTHSVLEYMLKIVDTKIQRNLGKHILTLEERAIAVRDSKVDQAAGTEEDQD